jgi:hypothetical protein
MAVRTSNVATFAVSPARICRVTLRTAKQWHLVSLVTQMRAFSHCSREVNLDKRQVKHAQLLIKAKAAGR